MALNEPTPEEIEAKIGKLKKMLMVSVLFVAVGYILILGALYLEMTGFHPAIEEFVTTFTEYSLAGGGPDRAGAVALNQQLAELHKFPSTLLWMKLGGIGHVLVGIFISLFVIVQELALMPHRLGYKMEKYSG